MAPLDATIVAAIQAAPREETNAAVAARLGVSETSVKRYRVESRREDEETARAIRAARVSESVGSALDALSEVREIAVRQYRADPTPAWCRAATGAIAVELAQVGPEALSDEELIERALGIVSGRGGAPGPD